MVSGVLTESSHVELLDGLSGSSTLTGVVLTVVRMIDPLMETRLPNRIKANVLANIASASCEISKQKLTSCSLYRPVTNRMI